MASDSKKRTRVVSDSNSDSEACEPVKKTSNSRVSVAIIGTAGRGGKGASMSKSLFMAMVKAATNVIENTWKLPWSQIDLVSGGAAWADHVAVYLFLRNQAAGTKLELFLPCSMDSSVPPKFLDNGIRDWRKNPGSSANQYHKIFSSALGYNTLSDFEQATQLGAVLNSEHFGFHERNKQVAKADYMLAFTAGDTEPLAGGTKHTWSLCTGQKVHIGLASLPVEESSETHQTTISSSNAVCNSKATPSQT